MTLPPRALRATIIALGVVVLLNQTRYLFYYPVIDTGMWFGDESWTMLTLRAMAKGGVARVPEALGSSLAHSNGLVNGSVWLSGLIYGLPCNLFGSLASPVAIGRTISLLLSLCILYLVFRSARRLEVSIDTALLALFLLIVSNLFFFSTHSARLDVITGLGVLGYLHLLLYLFQVSQQRLLAQRWYFAMTFIAAASLCIYVHVPTLIALPCLFGCWRMGAFRSIRSAVLTILGGVAGVLFIALLYWLSTGSFSLLGHGYNQYYNVANSLPILHPFSWQVQKINTIDRFLQVWSIAGPLVTALMISVVAVLAFERVRVTQAQRFYLQITTLVIISWMLSEGPAIYYNIHATPVVVVVTAILLEKMLRRWNGRFSEWTAITVVVILAAVTLKYQSALGQVGKTLSVENESAVAALTGPIRALHPIVLVDQPAMNQVAADTQLRLMTNHVLLFGEEDKPLQDILREHGVQYLLLYSTSKWQSPLRAIADSMYTTVGERTGWLTDQARSYDGPDWEDLDTLRLYKAR